MSCLSTHSSRHQFHRCCISCYCCSYWHSKVMLHSGVKRAARDDADAILEELLLQDEEENDVNYKHQFKKQMTEMRLITCSCSKSIALAAQTRPVPSQLLSSLFSLRLGARVSIVAYRSSNWDVSVQASRPSSNTITAHLYQHTPSISCWCVSLSLLPAGTIPCSCKVDHCARHGTSEYCVTWLCLSLTVPPPPPAPPFAPPPASPSAPAPAPTPALLPLPFTSPLSIPPPQFPLRPSALIGQWRGTIGWNATFVFVCVATSISLSHVTRCAYCHVTTVATVSLVWTCSIQQNVGLHVENLASIKQRCQFSTYL